MQTAVRSPLIWFGGKGKVAQKLIDRMPPHKSYIEPFGGAAHVIAQKAPIAHEVYNDIDGLVVNFIMVARAEPERLMEACETLPYARQLFEQWKQEPMPADPFEKAVRWFYLNRSGIAKGNAREVTNTGWRHFTKGASTAAAYQSACQIIPAFAKRMREVMIEHRDFRDIIERFDSPDTLFYIDPPYVGKEKWYAGGFCEQDHRDLAALLSKVDGKVILSYYDDPLLDELYPNWRREKFDDWKNVPGGENRWAEEMLLFNWQDPQMSIFDTIGTA